MHFIHATGYCDVICIIIDICIQNKFLIHLLAGPLSGPVVLIFKNPQIYRFLCFRNHLYKFIFVNEHLRANFISGARCLLPVAKLRKIRSDFLNEPRICMILTYF